MSSGATQELDFFGMEKENHSKSQLQRLLQQRKNIRGVQTSLSKINPQLLKTVIESGTANGTADNQEMAFGPKSVPSTPIGNQTFVSTLPLFNSVLRAASETAQETQNAPLTIFYNGKVSVFDLPRDKAEIIMKLVEEGNLKAPTESMTDLKVAIPSTSTTDEQKKQLFEKLNGDLPIARKKSLQRFLEKRLKRKERLTMVSPYAVNLSSDCKVERSLNE